MLDLLDGWSLYLLALVIWREARGEPYEAKVAVGHSILNRVARPSWWGRSIPTVIRKRFQYSSMTAPDDPQLGLWPDDVDPSWAGCLDIAQALLGTDPPPNPVPGADSYYDVSLDPKPPSWSKAARSCGKIGRIRFFDVDNDFERWSTGP